VTGGGHAVAATQTSDFAEDPKITDGIVDKKPGSIDLTRLPKSS
jgi:hypothetical protein